MKFVLRKINYSLNALNEALQRKFCRATAGELLNVSAYDLLFIREHL
jgi:hypothetical protein